MSPLASAHMAGGIPFQQVVAWTAGEPAVPPEPS